MEEDSAYAIKRIKFFGRSVPVFLQNLNGPCPLLSLANVLSLRNELKLPPRAASSREISQHDLISLVAERLLEASKQYENVPEFATNLQQNISDSFEVLQKLSTGVDVNVSGQGGGGCSALIGLATGGVVGRAAAGTAAMPHAAHLDDRATTPGQPPQPSWARGRVEQPCLYSTHVLLKGAPPAASPPVSPLAPSMLRSPPYPHPIAPPNPTPSTGQVSQHPRL